MSQLTLIIGNKKYSSWSLRPWLLLRHFGIAFAERRIALSTPETRDQINSISPSRYVPVLQDGDFTVWDSLAICEYVNECHLSGRGWPADRHQRARARSLAAEMHSGFTALRTLWPMNVAAQCRLTIEDQALQSCIERIQQIWRECLDASGGPWLFGGFGIVDAMFAPVALRFRSYQPPLDDTAQSYCRTVLAHSAVLEWIAAGCAESEIIAGCEVC